MKTQEDLYLEYARIIIMVREYNEKNGTNVKPWECVKLGNVFRREHGHPGFGGDPDDYTFAIAILEGKPVFVGDEIYYKLDGKKVQIGTGGIIFNENNWSWTPPQKKRTFEYDIDIEGLPNGWRAVAYRIPMHNEFTLDDNNNPISTMAISFPCLIVEKIQTRRIVLEETEEERSVSYGDWFQTDEGLIKQWDREDVGSLGCFKIWREVKEG